MVISASINRYIFIAINRTFTNDYSLKYSALERVDTIEEIEHPIVREAFRRHPVGPGIEMVSVADIPAGTGLGSSAAFTVGLFRPLCLSPRRRACPHPRRGGMRDRDRVSRSPGRKARSVHRCLRGLSCLDLDRDGTVEVSPLAVSNQTLRISKSSC